MIQKSKTCLYCGEEMESKTAKKRFCSDLHRVYYNREKNKPIIEQNKEKQKEPEKEKEFEAVDWDKLNWKEKLEIRRKNKL